MALVAALLIKTFAVQAFSIPSQSMEPTLMPGDRVLVDKLASDFSPVRTGDIVVFRRPPADTSPVNDLIKRVIGGPGQSIYVANCKVYVNGKELIQRYLPRGLGEPKLRVLHGLGRPGHAQPARPLQGPCRPLLRNGRQPERLRRLKVLGAGAGELFSRRGLCPDVAAKPCGLVIARTRTGTRRRVGRRSVLTLAQPAQDPLMVTIPPFGAERVPFREPDLPPTDVVAVRTCRCSRRGW